jgi:tetratricopeptide (TPR) repeat protein
MATVNAWSEKKRTYFICVGLALAILAAYIPLWHCGFVLFDDNDYVFANPVVRRGLTWAGLRWAFTTTYASNWHPLTWISHMIDCQVYGLNPVGHHVTSLLLHVANSILLFLLLRRMTRVEPASALVAALFALHPVHVESVAWISERKDVLSTLFWLLTVWAYASYTDRLRPGWYLFSLCSFVLGLMAKPMVVTLPVILILLDYWPLQRQRVPVNRLVAEKIPYLALAAAASVITLLAQKSGGAIAGWQDAPLMARLANVPVAYFRYVEKLFVPIRLAAFYPLPAHWPTWTVAITLVFIGACTLWTVKSARTKPFFVVGWFWFLIMLLPVIGLIQVGSQAMADRYDYLPSVGIFIIVIWGLRSQVMQILCVIALGGCCCATWVQVGYWRDSERLFRHALDVTTDNAVMENDLGKVLLLKNRPAEALPHLKRAVDLAPTYPMAHYNLGQADLATGDVADALAQFETQVALQPADPIAHSNFGRVLLEHGLASDALAPLEKAVMLEPQSAENHRLLADANRQTGRSEAAERQYEKCLELNPADTIAELSLAWMLSTQPNAALRNGPRALELARRAQENSGSGEPRALGILAAAYAETSDFHHAIETAEKAMQAAAARGQTALTQALGQQLESYRAGKPFRDRP